MQVAARFLAAAVVVASLLGCGNEDQPRAAVEVASTAPLGTVLRLGDVDPDTPARRTLRLQPLGDYLARELADQGVSRVQVVIARDMEEMAHLLADRKVDLYLDSVFPTLRVSELCGSQILLQRWAQGAASYRSIIVTGADSSIESVEQLRGSAIALQEEYSTSGFLLPASWLNDKGLELEKVSGLDERPTTDKVHYFFTRDEENTIELVSTNRAPAGAISEQDYGQLPIQLRDRLRVLAQTPSVPRQLISARSDLDPALVGGITDALLALAGRDDEPVVLEDSPSGWTWKFEAMTPQASETIDKLKIAAQRLDLL